MKRPLTTQRFSDYKRLENRLKSENIPFTVKDIFSDFWGKEYTIPHPTGRGSMERAKTILKILDGK